MQVTSIPEIKRTANLKNVQPWRVGRATAAQRRGDIHKTIANTGGLVLLDVSVEAENPQITHARGPTGHEKVKISFKIEDFGLRRSKIPSILHTYGKTINQITNHWRRG
jgi:hypothetical protein